MEPNLDVLSVYLNSATATLGKRSDSPPQFVVAFREGLEKHFVAVHESLAGTEETNQDHLP